MVHLTTPMPLLLLEIARCNFPIIQGADIAGVIVSCGTNVGSSRTGQRVMVDFGVYAGPGDDIPSHDYIGSGRPGGFAEHVVQSHTLLLAQGKKKP